MLVGDDERLESVRAPADGGQTRGGFSPAKARVHQQPGLLRLDQRRVAPAPAPQHRNAHAHTLEPFADIPADARSSLPAVRQAGPPSELYARGEKFAE